MSGIYINKMISLYLKISAPAMRGLVQPRNEADCACRQIGNLSTLLAAYCTLR